MGLLKSTNGTFFELSGRHSTLDLSVTFQVNNIP